MIRSLLIATVVLAGVACSSTSSLTPRVARPAEHAMLEPAMLPALAPPAFTRGESVTTARWAQDLVGRPPVPSLPDLAAARGLSSGELHPNPDATGPNRCGNPPGTAPCGESEVDREVFGIDNGSNYIGSMANRSVYLNNFLTLPNDVFYAPTGTMVAGISCVEVATIYTSGYAPQIGFYDWCGDGYAGKGHVGWSPSPVAINQAFFDNYVRLIDGLNRYTVRELRLRIPRIGASADAKICGVQPCLTSGASQWIVQLYNYATRHWDLVYESGIYNDTDSSGHRWKCALVLKCQGFEQFETYVQPNTVCPSLAMTPISSSGISLIDKSGTSHLVGNEGYFYAGVSHNGCFQGTSAPYYTLTVNSPNYWWTATGG